MTNAVRLGPNSLLPCGSESARRRHLARGEDCRRCRTDEDGRMPDWPFEWFQRAGAA